MRILCVLLLTASICLAGERQTWYVNNLTGDDSFDGHSAGTAFKTLAQATAKLKPSDRLEIANTGTPYYEELRLHGTMGTAAQPLEIDGHGAVISGLKALTAAWEAHEQGFRYPHETLPSNLKPRLWLDDTPIPEAKDLASCAVGEAVWLGDGFYFRPENPELLQDPRLRASLGVNGLAGTSLRYVTVRNLICERSCNDGFNVHGNSYGLYFEHIEARWNGDDGFSIHEDCATIVRDAHFHHNSYGIENVNASRSIFYGVTLNDNLTGVHFSGGHHQLIDCLITGSKLGLLVNGGQPSSYLGKPGASVRGTFHGEVLVKDTEIANCEAGIHIDAGASAQVIQALIHQIKANGLSIKRDARVDLIGTILASCGQNELLFETTSLYDDANLFEHGSIGGSQGSGLAALQALNPATSSEIGDPQLVGDTRHTSNAPPIGKLRRGPAL